MYFPSSHAFSIDALSHLRGKFIQTGFTRELLHCGVVLLVLCGAKPDPTQVSSTSGCPDSDSIQNKNWANAHSHNPSFAIAAKNLSTVQTLIPSSV